jgi:hypothetical protein
MTKSRYQITYLEQNSGIVGNLYKEVVVAFPLVLTAVQPEKYQKPPICYSPKYRENFTFVLWNWM